MADKPGFMEQLTGSSVDEQQAVLNAPVPGTGSGSQIAARVRQNVERGGAQLGAGIAGMASGFFNKKEGESFLEASNRGTSAIMDEYVAGQLGIKPVDLRARREIRKELTQMSVEDDGTPSARLKMANRAVEVAKRVGSDEQLQRAHALVDQLKQEEAEWSKLNAETEAKEIKNVADSTVTAYRPDGTAISGTLQKKDGVAGIMTAAGWRPFQEGVLSLHDPEQSAQGGPDLLAETRKRIKDSLTPSAWSKLRARAAGGMASLIKTDRVLATLTDLYEQGGVGSVLSTSGKMLAAVDNFVRNAKGFVNAFASQGMSEHNNTLRNSLIEGVKSGTTSLLSLIELPPGVEKGSAAAQQHQAAIMEMAYMAARLAEPSNRGLSDNDIANALKRIAGGTSNPQVMARRFVEMQADAAAELEFELDFFRGGSLGDQITDEMVDTALLGGAYQKYNEKKREIFEKYGVVVGDDGRATFAAGSKLGVDVTPGEGIGIEPTLEAEQDVTDEEIFNEVFGDQG